MRAGLYLLFLLTAGLNMGCQSQNESEMHFGPNPGDRLMEDEATEE